MSIYLCALANKILSYYPIVFVAVSNFAVVNTYVAGKQTQLWLRTANGLRNRKDKNKVINAK